MSKRMRAAYERGATIAEVSEKFGVSLYLAKKKLLAAGTKIRERGGKQWARPSLMAERRSILRDYKAGFDVASLAAYWGVTRGRIYQVIGRQR